MSISNIHPTATSFCDAVYGAGTSGVEWLGRNARALACGTNGTLKNVWRAVSTFFGKSAVALGAFLATVKNTATSGILAAKDAIKVLPKEAKVVLGLGAVTVALASALATRYYSQDAKPSTSPEPLPEHAEPAANAGQIQELNDE